MGEPARRITISQALHQSGLYGRVARLSQEEAPPEKKANDSLEFAKRHVKGSESIRQKILWSDEAKM
jgi:hypothetical protein